MIYTIEQRIHTLAQNAILGHEKAGFTVDNVAFVHWGSDVTHDWSYDFWLATTQVDAENYHLAFHQFRAALLRIVTRISLVSQCYIDSVLQPIPDFEAGRESSFF